MRKDITIVGAGLAGLVTALYLARRGYAVSLYEWRPDPREQGQDGGRSINLAISRRGIYALEELGIAKAVLKTAIPMEGRMVHSMEGDVHLQPYSPHKTYSIYAITRHHLYIALLEAVSAYATITVYFQQNLIAIDTAAATLTFRDAITNSEYTLETKQVIGADGTGSVIRHGLVDQGIATFKEEYLLHGYKELTIPEEYAHLLYRNALHIWPRHDFMLIALPNSDATFTCTLFLAKEGEESFASLQDESQVHHFFHRYFADVRPLMPQLTREFFANPVGSLVNIQGGPWYTEKGWTLLGDAAHGIVPFFGQGMNSAFEDGTVLNELLQRYDDNWEKALPRFYELRKVNTDSMAAMSLDNYYEMRDATSQTRFQLRKQVEHWLMTHYADVYIDKYALVSFHRVPYAYAQRCGELQRTLLDELCNGLDKVENLEIHSVKSALARYEAALQKI
ncbi:MAG: FAD-dependent oxidoreductase [Gammaproteobacteria bacterium]